MAGERDEGAEHRPGAAKAALRAQARARRAALAPAERAAATQRVVSAVLALPEIAAARTVLAYAAFGDELSVDGVAEALLRDGRTVCFPRIAGAAFEGVPVLSLEELTPGWRGVREPPGDGLAIDLTRFDAVLVPGLAFDRRGHRLGYGGGHFDRFLAQLPETALTIGVAFAAQVVDALPEEAHDRAVRVLVTEQGTTRTR